MSTDPDFHPLAGAWLDGTAAPPEQKLLGEILYIPDLMREYAALCRTEALLALSDTSATRRSAALSRMLDGKPWPRRLMSMGNHRAFRWAAAAAVIALTVWWLWPTSVEDAGENRRRIIPPRVAETLAPGVPADAPTAEPPLPPAAEGLEQRLRRDYISGIQISGPLPQAAAALAKAADRASHLPLIADVRHEGDASVHLHLSTALPAWTLLELMALQTGTEVQLSGHTLVFRKARKPVPLTGKLSRTSELTPLRTLFAIMARDSHAAELTTFAERGAAALAATLEFKEASETSARFTGTPRDVRVLDLALNSINNPPVMVSLSMKLVELPPGFEPEEILATAPDQSGPALAGVFTDEQFQNVIRKLSMHEGVDLATLLTRMTRPNEEVKLQTNPGKRDLVAMLVASPEGAMGCKLKCEIGWGVGLPGEGENNASGLVNTEVLIWSGQTVCLAGFRAKGGSQLFAFITATLLQPDGTPLSPPGKAPSGPPDSRPRDELPYGIPVTDQPGMVQSPYAPEKGLVDVKGLKRDTRVMCPYTGKHFRVP